MNLKSSFIRNPRGFSFASPVKISLVTVATLLPCLSLAVAQHAETLTSKAWHDGRIYAVENGAIRASFSVEGSRISPVQIRDVISADERILGPGFSLTFDGKPAFSSRDAPIAAPPSVLMLAANASATREAERRPGSQICVEYLPDPQLTAHWCLVVRDGSRYVRETLTLRAEKSPAALREVSLLDFRDPEAHVVGTVPGSPVIDDAAFFTFEHPLAKVSAAKGQVSASLLRTLPLQPGQEISYSSAVGFAEPGQMRRAFLAYLENERIHPYRPFLTYNSWYDLGFGERYGEKGALDRVHAFASELSKRRGVVMNSFLFDDGWDDPDSLWRFNAGFPNGMHEVSTAASTIGAGVGIWLSPWGGYDEAKKRRISYGQAHGYEIVNNGYALSGPKYYNAFQDVCLKLIADYGVNQFKFDGTGNADQVFAGSAYDSDFDAAIHMMSVLRAKQPGLFINLTTGTYPSPFWLEYADSIWRGGEDHGFAGVGSWRQKWITYRDAQTYANIVKRGPLFPLNSLMLHSIIYAQRAEHLGATEPDSTASDGDFTDEVWTFFGSGTDLQELYITPTLLNADNWDELAAAARWSRANSGTLIDTHWVGADPASLSIYGWASWADAKAILTLRNPSEKTQEIQLDASSVFELPRSEKHKRFYLRDVRRAGKSQPVELSSAHPTRLVLGPFQVRVLEGSSR